MQQKQKHYRATEKLVREQLEGQFLTGEEVQKQNLFFGVSLLISLLGGIIIGALSRRK